VPDSMTQVLSSGPPGAKVNIAVLGDGFTAGEQAVYDGKVRELLIEGVFAHDYFYEDAQAFNVYRVNLVSPESGVSRRVYKEAGGGASTGLVDTALGWVYNGSGDHGWVEHGQGTEAAMRRALDAWVPDYHLVVVVLNEPGFGGCGGGGLQVVTLGVAWTALAHELGHAVGGLADECCQSRPWPAGEPGAVNLTTSTSRTALKWGRFVAPSTPVPTGIGTCAGYNRDVPPAGWDPGQDVGLFEGGGGHGMGVFRPVLDCRMRSDDRPWCPVCYTELKTRHQPRTGHSFRNCHAGDFDGDGRDELLVHSGEGVLLYRSNGTQLDLAASVVGTVPGPWRFQPGDRFHVGDVDGDGRDELVVYNVTDWDTGYLGLLAADGRDGLHLVARYDGGLPGWAFRPADRLLLADFDGDGRADLYVFNGDDWSIPYLGMLRSRGSSLGLVRRFDGGLPGWAFRPADRFHVGDFDGDGRADLYVFNGSDWAVPYLGMLRSTGAGLELVRRFDAALPGWALRPGDRFHVGDFDGDGRADLYVFNGDDWSMAHLLMACSTGSGLDFTERYDGNAPGWQMRRHDRHWVADCNGDGRDDLFVHNDEDWGHEYLGAMISNSKELNATRREDWVGEWSLGPEDRFLPCNYQGGAGTPDLIVHNADWLGMIRATPALVLDRVYHHWIHNYRYGRNW